jgi:hypothetical protein
MKRALFIAIGGFLMLVWASPGAAQIPAQGLSALVCLAGVQGEGTYPVSPRLVVVVSGDDGASATVTITHGEDGSIHEIDYLDTDSSGDLNCGDRITGVS